MSEIKVLKADPTHIREIARIHVLGWRTAYRGIVPDDYLDSELSEDRTAEIWTAPGTGHLVSADPRIGVYAAFAGNNMAGFCSVFPARDPALSGYAEMGAIYLDPAYQGLGIGRALFARTMEHVRAHGWSKLYVRVLEDNGAGRAFYERMGGTEMEGFTEIISIGGKELAVSRYAFDDG